MHKVNEIVLNGPVIPSEIDELSELIGSSEVEVHHYSTKSQEVKELIDVIFNDFNTTIFVRDLLLSKAIEGAYHALKLAFQYFKGKGKKIEAIGLEKDFLTVEGKAFRIRILTKPEQFDMLITHVSSIPEGELIPEGDDTFVDVLIDAEGHITINVM
jgi:hypothetical protein